MTLFLFQSIMKLRSDSLYGKRQFCRKQILICGLCFLTSQEKSRRSFATAPFGAGRAAREAASGMFRLLGALRRTKAPNLHRLFPAGRRGARQGWSLYPLSSVGPLTAGKGRRPRRQIENGNRGCSAETCADNIEWKRRICIPALRRKN